MMRRLLLSALVALAAQTALAQGGPPLVTDDPETPGDGHWEINLATIGTHTDGRWEVAAPDADINYGLGDHIQLKLDMPWTFAHESGQAWKSGLGSVNAGVKWRFIDKEKFGFAMSTYPQFTSNWVASSERRGIVSPGHNFFLPLEAATEVGGYALDAEIGRDFVQDGPNAWAGGLVVGHACGASVECLAEVHETVVPHNAQTLLNFGVHWKLNESLIVLAAAGREFGPRNEDQQRGLFYLGLQIVR